MNVGFCKPDDGKGAGGLDAAIIALADNLRGAGCQIQEVGPDAGDEVLTDVDLVHFHGLWHPWHSRHAAALRRLAVPHAVSPHGMLEPWAWRHKRWKKLPYFLLRERRYLGGADALVATSDMEARNLSRFFPDARIATVPLGLTGEARPGYDAARRELGWQDDDRRTLLYLSRIHPKKGLDMLLEALAGMRVRAFCRLVVVGGADTDFQSRIDDLLAAHRDALPEIDWVGEVWGEARWKYFQGADLFCLPTHSENFGLAVLEALQVGTPVLTTTTTPWAGFLEGRDGGFIVNPDVPSIQHGLLQYFRMRDWNADSREALADWAWRTFHWDRLAREMLSLYRSLG